MTLVWRDRAIWLWAAASLAIAAVGMWWSRYYFVDDAYISLRYCYNFLNGDGLVWNPGERVEGYSNFLQVILMSALGGFGLDLTLAARLVPIAAYAGLVVFLLVRAQRDPHHVADTLPLIFVTASLPVVIWTLGGLEATIMAALVAVAVWRFADALDGHRGIATLAPLFVLIAMTRHDGIGFFIVSLAAAGIAWKRQGRPNGKDILAFIAIFAVLYGTYTVWRVLYYGDLLPNPYYAKSSYVWMKMRRGLEYVRIWGFGPPYLLPLFAAGGVYLTVARRWRASLAYLAVLSAGYVLYVARVGGDFMPGFRLVVPVIPPLAIFLSLVLREMWSSPVTHERWLIACGAVVLCALQLVIPIYYMRPAPPDGLQPPIAQVIGEYISSHWPKGCLIALNTAGATPYFAPDNRYIDMLGINDRHIARQPSHYSRPAEVLPGHEKGDGAYVLSRQPDYIICGFAQGSPVSSPVFRTDAELKVNHAFRAAYQMRQVEIDVSRYPGMDRSRAAHDGTLTFTFYERHDTSSVKDSAR